MSDEEHVFKVIASRTVEATFEVYAEDEDDARDQVENPPHMMYDVSVSDAMSVIMDEWDVTDIEEKVSA